MHVDIGKKYELHVENGIIPARASKLAHTLCLQGDHIMTYMFLSFQIMSSIHKFTL